MSKSTKPSGKVTVNRSAVTGQFVTKSFAKSHPRTTVTERIKKTS